MKSAFKYIFKPLYNFLKSEEVRNFHEFLDGKRTRFKVTGECTFQYKNFRITVPHRKSFAYQFRDIFINEIYNFQPTSKPPVILDCGANVGIGTLYFKSQHPDARILAFEPDPYIFSFLIKNISENSIRGVEAINKAVWIKNGRISFSSDKKDGGYISRKGEGNSEVETCDLLEIITREKKVDLLKMDIESAEDAVFPRLEPVLYKIEKIFLEYHSFKNCEQKLHELLNILNRNGFRYFLQSTEIEKKPFGYRKTGESMDLKINIFADKP